jgi:hypothetical protein
MSDFGPTKFRLRDALEHLVNWQEYCLNAGIANKTARSAPDDDHLCELFNRLNYARAVLRGKAA